MRNDNLDDMVLIEHYGKNGIGREAGFEIRKMV